MPAKSRSFRESIRVEYRKSNRQMISYANRSASLLEDDALVAACYLGFGSIYRRWVLVSDSPLWVISGRRVCAAVTSARANKQTISSLLGAILFPVSNKKFPVSIAGNSSKKVSCFSGFVQAGRGLSTEIPCIFPNIREFDTETRSLQPPSTATPNVLIYKCFVSSAIYRIPREFPPHFGPSNSASSGRDTSLGNWAAAGGESLPGSVWGSTFWAADHERLRAEQAS
jgi:hypothetical protein